MFVRPSVLCPSTNGVPTFDWYRSSSTGGVCWLEGGVSWDIRLVQTIVDWCSHRLLIVNKSPTGVVCQAVLVSVWQGLLGVWCSASSSWAQFLPELVLCVRHPCSLHIVKKGGKDCNSYLCVIKGSLKASKREQSSLLFECLSSIVENFVSVWPPNWNNSANSEFQWEILELCFGKNIK